MKEWTCNKYSLCLLLLASFITACSHSPTKTDFVDNIDLNKTNSVTLDQKPDLIIPPLRDSLNDDIVEKNNGNRQIWEHISNKLELTKFYDHPRVVLQKRKYLNHSEYLSIVTKRSEPFIHFVLAEVEKRQMPAELAILPIVESGYYPRARSRAKAEGLWQIMSYTGKELGLKRTFGYDGRHDVYEATSAALSYLEQMYNRFDGDWLLALAAYNAGPQRIQRVLRSIEKRPGFTVHDENIFWKLHLPQETREYIPKILAISAIIKDKDYSGTLLYPIADEPYLETIQLTKCISPTKLIQTTDVSESEIKLLNPALRNLSVPTIPGYHLLVPKGDAKLLTQAIDQLQEETQPLLAKHKIKRGESLSSIARTYGTSVMALRRANNLYGNTIVAGHSLLVPSQEDMQIAKTTAKQIKKNIQKNTHPAVKNPSNKYSEPYIYVVALGDSYWKIANRNNTTVQRLFEINDRSAEQPLQPGETILVD